MNPNKTKFKNDITVVISNRRWTPQMDEIVTKLRENIQNEIRDHFDNFENIVIQVSI